MKLKDRNLVVIAYSGLIIAVLSAFTTIVGYTNSYGIHKSFSLIDFISDARGFGSFVFSEYVGDAVFQYNPGLLFILIALGVAAIVCAFLGLIRLSKQTDNKVSYVLTIVGLIGTMAPSVVLFILIIMLKDNYLGEISCGVYPIVSPIAMIACIAATTAMRRRNIIYRKKLKEAEGLIFRGEDL